MKLDDSFIKFVNSRRENTEVDLVESGTFTEDEVRVLSLQVDSIYLAYKRAFLDIPVVVVLVAFLIYGLIRGTFSAVNSIPVLVLLSFFLWELVPFVLNYRFLKRNSITMKMLKSVLNLNLI